MKSKALTILDSLSDDDIERPEAAEYYDERLFDALKAIAAVIDSAANKKETKEAPEPDYTKSLNSIAAMIANADAAKEIRALRADMASIASAVAAIKSPDMGGVISAIERLAASNKMLTSAMTAPRTLTYDANGEPNGLRIERAN